MGLHLFLRVRRTPRLPCGRGERLDVVEHRTPRVTLPHALTPERPCIAGRRGSPSSHGPPGRRRQRSHTAAAAARPALRAHPLARYSSSSKRRVRPFRADIGRCFEPLSAQRVAVANAGRKRSSLSRRRPSLAPTAFVRELDRAAQTADHPDVVHLAPPNRRRHNRTGGPPHCSGCLDHDWHQVCFDAIDYLTKFGPHKPIIDSRRTPTRST